MWIYFLVFFYFVYVLLWLFIDLIIEFSIVVFYWIVSSGVFGGVFFVVNVLKVIFGFDFDILLFLVLFFFCSWYLVDLLDCCFVLICCCCWCILIGLYVFDMRYCLELFVKGVLVSFECGWFWGVDLVVVVVWVSIGR